MVMGPTCGLVLGDLGAEVIKIEPLKGDNTRRLKGSGAGFFAAFNRNKKSIAIDLHQSEGLEIAKKLIAKADIVSHNFKPSTMHKLGLDYESLSTINQKLIYVSHQGFLPGPYEHRTALDEVVQMMGGLAYMTGRPGDPLRAGSSVNDIMGGMFGSIGAMAALLQRAVTGKGQKVQSALFENNVFLVAQHMLQFAVTGVPAAPMPARVSAWGIYDVFTVKNNEQVFLAVVSETQWAVFCDAFGISELKTHPSYNTNNQRVQNRDTLLPKLQQIFLQMTAGEISEKFESHGLPFAPITKPEDLFNDPHLNASGGLREIALPDADSGGEKVKVPLLPFTMGGHRPSVRQSPPQLGEHTNELLASLGYCGEDIETLRTERVVG